MNSKTLSDNAKIIRWFISTVSQPSQQQHHLDHLREVAGISEFKDNVQFVVLDERREILDHVRVIQLLRAGNRCKV